MPGLHVRHQSTPSRVGSPPDHPCMCMRPRSDMADSFLASVDVVIHDDAKKLDDIHGFGVFCLTLIFTLRGWEVKIWHSSLKSRLQKTTKGQRPYKLFWHGEASMLHPYIQRGAYLWSRGRARLGRRPAPGHGPQVEGWGRSCPEGRALSSALT